MTRTALLLFSAASAALCFQRPPVIENDQVRVLVVTDQPHRKSQRHEHKMNRVMIYLDAGTNRLTYDGGKVENITVKAGDVKWSPAGGFHVSENPGDKPLRIVEVELKNKGSEVNFPARDPVKLDPKEYKIEFENPQVRVLRVRIGAHRKVPMHAHALNRVVAYLTDQHVRVTQEGGKGDETTAKAGEVRWAGPATHAEENLGDKLFEVAVVELK